MTDPIFGDVIYHYSRQNALDDGVIVDVTETAKEAGFRIPVSISASIHRLCTPPKGSVQSYNGRLWDVLWMASLAARAASKKGPTDRVTFTVKIGRKNHRMIVHIGPGDDPKPVVSIYLPEDD